MISGHIKHERIKKQEALFNLDSASFVSSGDTPSFDCRLLQLTVLE
jgi:hypothetical protein